MVSHRSLSDSLLKSSELFWPISIMHSSSDFQVLQSLYQSSGDCTKDINYNWYNSHFHVPQFFQLPRKVQVLILLFAFFQFYSVVSQDSKVHDFASSLFFVDFYKVWLSGQDLVIHLYLKNPLEFVHLILQDRFWVVHIPFVCMVKFQFLAQFYMDPLAHSVMFILLHFLGKFTAFIYYVIDDFVTITT